MARSSAGSQREDDYDRLLARIRQQGLDPEAYRWYLDLRKYGTFVHSGLRARARADRRLDHAACPTSAKRSRFPGRSTAVSLAGPPSPPSPHPTSRPASPAPPRARSMPRASASRSTASNRSRNFRLAPSSAGPGCTPALRARLTTANSRSPISLDHRVARRRAPACSGRAERSRARARSAGPKLGLDLRQLLAHLGCRPGGVGPVETHRGRALLQPVGLEQRRQGRRDPGKRAAAALLALDPFPRLRVTQVEQVRVAPAHLPLEPGRRRRPARNSPRSSAITS